MAISPYSDRDKGDLEEREQVAVFCECEVSQRTTHTAAVPPPSTIATRTVSGPILRHEMINENISEEPKAVGTHKNLTNDINLSGSRRRWLRKWLKTLTGKRPSK